MARYLYVIDFDNIMGGCGVAILWKEMTVGLNQNISVVIGKGVNAIHNHNRHTASAVNTKDIFSTVRFCWTIVWVSLL